MRNDLKIELLAAVERELIEKGFNRLKEIGQDKFKNTVKFIIE